MKLFVPGRICLLGEHSDWASGYRTQNPDIPKGKAIVAPTTQGLYATIAKDERLIICSTMPDGKRLEPAAIPMTLEALQHAAQGNDFFRYVAGVGYHMKKIYGVGGLHIDNYKTDLPIQKGLSSSAAICVLTARAFNKIYGLNLSIEQEMEAAYQGERLTGSACGKMDQLCAFSTATVVTFDGPNLDIEELKPKRPLWLLVVDLQGSKDTTRILRDLNDCYPFPKTDIHRQVQLYLGKQNANLTKQATDAILNGNVSQLGKLMTTAQEQFDAHVAPACPAQLQAPLLHDVLAFPPIQHLILGGKGVGSQGDGCAQFLVNDQQTQAQVAEIIRQQLHLPCLPMCVG